MPITIIYQKQELQMEGKPTVRQLLEHLGLSPESHLVVRSEVLLTDDQRLQDGDVVKLIAVISGGHA